MTYNTEINDLRRQVDRLDHEIIDKIVELSKLINCYKHKNNQNTEFKDSQTIEFLSRFFKENLLKKLGDKKFEK